MAILKIKDKGVWKEIQAIKGDKGEQGIQGIQGEKGDPGTTNYNELTDKPQINSVELKGNKSLSDLGIINYDDTEIKEEISNLETTKQNKLTAGENITIENNVISATGGGATDKHLTGVSVESSESHEEEVTKTTEIGDKTKASSYASGSAADKCWWITNLPAYVEMIGKKIDKISFTTSSTGTLKLYSYDQEISCTDSTSAVATASATADSNRKLLVTITVPSTGYQTFKLDGTDSNVAFASGITEFIMPASLGLGKDVSAKFLYNNTNYPVAEATKEEVTIYSGFQQAGSIVPKPTSGYQALDFDFTYTDTIVIPGDYQLRHKMSDDTNIDVPLENLLIDGTISEEKLTQELQDKINLGANGLKGKYISIIGDSISTFKGYVPSGYASYYPSGDVTTVDKTWWYKLVNETKMNLLVNASWSGSTVSGKSTRTSGYDTASTTYAYPACSNKRISDLKTSEHTPDIIVCFIGTNDWGTNRCLPLGDWNGKSAIPSDSSTGMNTLGEAYGLMLYKIMSAYPNAKVYCCTMHEYGTASSVYCPSGAFPNYNSITDTYQVDFNAKIKEVANAMGATVIDLFNDTGITFWNTSTYLKDGVHPSSAGMELIKECIKAQLIKDYGVLSLDVTDGNEFTYGA